MCPLTIKSTNIGEGKPKICIPIMGKTKQLLIEEINELHTYPCDIVEWRMDYFDSVFLLDVLLDTLETIYNMIDNKLLLVTFRTHNEGGEKEIDVKTYACVLETIMQSKHLDMIDLECYFNDDAINHLVEVAHQNDIVVVMSHHNFNHTLTSEEMMTCINDMSSKQADIYKLAMMPNNKEDVFSLLNFTKSASEGIENPLITMSMGSMGVLSRIIGFIYGSSVTFACMDKESAPGQINAKKLNDLLSLIDAE